MLEAIEFLQEKLNESIASKASYLAKRDLGGLEAWEEIGLQMSEKEIKNYAYSIACLNTLNQLKQTA